MPDLEAGRAVRRRERATGLASVALSTHRASGGHQRAPGTEGVRPGPSVRIKEWYSGVFSSLMPNCPRHPISCTPFTAQGHRLLSVL